tara:strand:- start:13648 stop:14178 length:531 start_codon:yes stop_codon:yes gene_type:complete
MQVTILGTGYDGLVTGSCLADAGHQVYCVDIDLAGISQHFGGQLEEKTFALWGLAFKPNTDDMREAPSQVLIELLLQAGARVRAYDPEALGEAAHIFGSRPGLELCPNQEQVLDDADALLICTEWKCFWNPDFDLLKQILKKPLIFDGRNLYDPEILKDLGFTYYAIGRGDSVRCF